MMGIGCLRAPGGAAAQSWTAVRALRARGPAGSRASGASRGSSAGRAPPRVSG